MPKGLCNPSRYFIIRLALRWTMSSTEDPEPIPLLAFHKGRTAQTSWNGPRGLQLTPDPKDFRMELALDLLKNKTEAIVLDGRGILRNMPDLAPLGQAAEDCRLWVDSGVRRGEDVIDVVMADVADPIVAARHLAGPDQLEIAADYCEQLMLALDWSADWAANPSWKVLDWETLGRSMQDWNVDQLLILCHDPTHLPHRPPSSWEALELYIVLFGGQPNPWPEAKVVRPLDLSQLGGTG